MKNLVSILILSFLFIIACANNNNQIPNSLSSSYDGIWDGYAQTPEYIINSYGVGARAPERLYMKAEVKNGIMSGFFFKSDGWYKGNPFKGFEGATSFKKKINGYITSDNKLFIDPVYAFFKLSTTGINKIIIETTLMSLNKIEGTWCVAQVAKTPKYNWFIVKPATGKSDNKISNVEGN